LTVLFAKRVGENIFRRNFLDVATIYAFFTLFGNKKAGGFSSRKSFGLNSVSK